MWTYDISFVCRSGKTNPIAVAETVLRAIATSDEGTKPLRAFVQINEDEVKRVYITLRIYCCSL